MASTRNNYLLFGIGKSIAMQLIGIVLCVSMIVIEATLVHEMDDDSWKYYHYKVYDTSTRDPNEGLTIEQTREYLLKLQKIYEPYSDKQTNGRKSRVEALVEASHIGLEFCHSDRFVSYNRLVDYHSYYPVNILPYLEHYYLEFHDTCLENVYDLLHDGVNSISKEHHADIALLTEMVAETSVPGKGVLGDEIVRRAPLEHLKVGILEFMKVKLGYLDVKLYRESKLGKTRFFADLEANVFTMCRAWSDQLDLTLTVLKMDTPIELNDEEHKWVTYGYLCGKIFERADDIYRDTYKAVKHMRQEDSHGKELSKFSTIWHNIAQSKAARLLRKAGHARRHAKCLGRECNRTEL